MSYSFSVRGATIALALVAVGAEIDKVVAGQPVHEADKKQALAAAESFVKLLPEDDTKDVVVSMNGSVGGVWQGSNFVRLTSASVSVSAYLVDRPQQA